MDNTNNAAASSLDALFTQARTAASSQPHAISAPASPPPQPRPFSVLLEEAEFFNDSTPGDDVSALIMEAKALLLNEFDTERLVKTISKKTKVSIAAIRKMATPPKRKVSEEDFGRKLAKYTLEKFYSNGDHIVRVAGAFWVYNGKYWYNQDDEQVSHNVNLALLDTENPEGIAHASAISQAMSLIRAVGARPEDVFSLKTEPKPVINCANGELWLSPDGRPTLKPHSHDSYLTSCLEVEYNPHAQCPMYDKALTDIFAYSKDVDGMVRHWHEMQGYAIQPNRDIAAWFLLKGRGANGKTKLVETLTERLIGASGVATTNIAKLDENRFAMSGLVGKLVVLDEDMDRSSSLPDGLLKKISERKSLDAEFKGKDIFKFVCRSLPIMMSNHFPRTNDSSDGMLRRANVIEFKRQFKGDEADVTLFPRIWESKEEMSGILNHAIAGYRRLIARGRFLPPVDCLEALEAWTCATNPTKAFIRSEMEYVGSGRVEWAAVWRRYQEWAREENMKFTTGRNKTKQEFVTLGIDFKLYNGYETLTGWKLKGLVEGNVSNEKFMDFSPSNNKSE